MLKDKNFLFKIFFEKLDFLLKDKNQTMIFEIKKIYGKNPFLILISCLLSLRSRDKVTLEICKKIFLKLKSPEDFLKIKIENLENYIKSIGFFKKKAKILKSVSLEIDERFNGDVPSEFEKLISINGIGRKTATLVLSEAFEKDFICVDTHVYRISKDLGITNKKSFFEVEKDLYNFFPKEYWKKINSIFVRYGQNVYKYNLKNRKDLFFVSLSEIIKELKTL